MGNGLGSIVVQAGANKNGRGFVSAGPFDGGIAGNMGGGLKPASSLLGRMRGK